MAPISAAASIFAATAPTFAAPPEFLPPPLFLPPCLDLSSISVRARFVFRRRSTTHGHGTDWDRYSGARCFTGLTGVIGEERGTLVLSYLENVFFPSL
jgi:hypothetical protein